MSVLPALSLFASICAIGLRLEDRQTQHIAAEPIITTCQWHTPSQYLQGNADSCNLSGCIPGAQSMKKGSQSPRCLTINLFIYL